VLNEMKWNKTHNWGLWSFRSLYFHLRSFCFINYSFLEHPSFNESCGCASASQCRQCNDALSRWRLKRRFQSPGLADTRHAKQRAAQRLWKRRLNSAQVNELHQVALSNRERQIPLTVRVTGLSVSGEVSLRRRLTRTNTAPSGML